MPESEQKIIHLLPRPVKPHFAKAERDDISYTVATMLLEGKSLRDCAAACGMAMNTLARLRIDYPDLREEQERAAFEGSTTLLEDMRDTPFTETDPARARVKIDALCRYLEMRWPERFGKRLDVTVKTLDLGSALNRARQRAGITIESAAYEVLSTDSLSVDGDTGSDLDELLE